MRDPRSLGLNQHALWTTELISNWSSTRNFERPASPPRAPRPALTQSATRCNGSVDVHLPRGVDSGHHHARTHCLPKPLAMEHLVSRLKVIHHLTFDSAVRADSCRRVKAPAGKFSCELALSIRGQTHPVAGLRVRSSAVASHRSGPLPVRPRTTTRPRPPASTTPASRQSGRATPGRAVAELRMPSSAAALATFAN